MPILDPNVKAAHLEHYCKQIGIDLIDAATIGDGANNLVLLQAAGMGVAFDGKPSLLAKVTVQLNCSDLRRLPYLQGYKERDFIANKILGFNLSHPDKRGQNRPICF